VRHIDESDLDDLAVGAAILGTGGGGNPYVGKLLAQQAIREHGPVTVVDVDEVDDDALAIPVAMMGAPTIMVEKLASGEEILSAVDAVANYLGRPMTHTARSPSCRWSSRPCTASRPRRWRWPTRRATPCS
jgi:DUF917 family protein